MTLRQAKKELHANINLGQSHAVLLHNQSGYYTALHTGFAGHCCCDDHNDYIWREASPYTDTSELDDIDEN